MNYAIVIELADNDPRVVVFDLEAEAQEWRDAYEKATEGGWDSDPQWNHYPREPIRTLPPHYAMSLLEADVRLEKETNPDEFES